MEQEEKKQKSQTAENQVFCPRSSQLVSIKYIGDS